MTVIWKDPPLKGGPGTWKLKLAPLMERPGEWALVHQSPTARAAYNLKAALASGKHDLPDGEWEFRSHRKDEGGEVYARFLGASSEVTA